MNGLKPGFFTLVFLIVSLISHAQSTDEFNLDKEYAIDPGGTISLQSDDADVTITGSDRENVHVVVHYKLEIEGFSFGQDEKFEMLVDEQNGNLRIYEKERDFGNRVTFGSSNEEYSITIEAPRGVSLDLDGDDEDYQITSIDGALKIDADDSSLELKDCNGDSFTFDMDDGEVRMDRGRGALSMDVDDGDVRILNGEFSEIDIDSDDSSIEITTQLAEKGNYRFNFDDADLSLNIAGGGGEFEVSHDNADISTSSEFEQVVDEENKSVYRLQGGNARVVIDTDDGDIEFQVI